MAFECQWNGQWLLIKIKIPLWNCNSITIIQQHLNIMQSTYEMLTSDFAETERTFQFLQGQMPAICKLIADLDPVPFDLDPVTFDHQVACQNTICYILENKFFDVVTLTFDLDLHT